MTQQQETAAAAARTSPPAGALALALAGSGQPAEADAPADIDCLAAQMQGMNMRRLQAMWGSSGGGSAAPDSAVPPGVLAAAPQHVHSLHGLGASLLINGLPALQLDNAGLRPMAGAGAGRLPRVPEEMQAAVAGLRASALALVTPAAHHAAAPPSSPVAGLVASCRAGRSSRKHQGHVRRGRTTRRHSPDTGRDSSIDSRHGQESGDRGRGIDAGAVCCSCAKRSSRASRGANSHARPRVELSSSTTVMTTTRSGGTGATTTTIATKTTSVRVRVLQGREGAAAHRQHYSQYLRVRTGAPASSSGGLASSLSALMDDLLLSADEQAEFLCEFDSHHEHAQDIEVEEFEERHYEEAEEEERAFAHQDAALALQLHELAARCALSHAQQQRERASAHELAALRTQAQALREQQALLAQQKAQLEQQLAQEKQALTAAQAQVHALDVAALGSALRGMGV